MARIVTFYSYKGGTGRSMALANVAWVLASCGLKVLAIDWDLEAPGLHRYFRPFLPDKELTRLESQGVIDIVVDFAERLAAQPATGGPPPRGWYKPYADITKWTQRLLWPSGEDARTRLGGSIDFVPAGRQGPLYAKRVNSFDWADFYERYDLGGFMDGLRASMAPYDWVLIDSRTGVSDTSGICTLQFPDILVVCFTLNYQSIDGAVGVAASAKAARASRPLRILPVPMRLDGNEEKLLNGMLSYARRSFSPLMDFRVDQDRYWREIGVPYFSRYAYSEKLAPFEDPRFVNASTSTLPAIERLTSYLTDSAITKLEPLPEEPRKAVLEEFELLPGELPADSARAAREKPSLNLLLKRAWYQWSAATKVTSGAVLSVGIVAAALFSWQRDSIPSNQIPKLVADARTDLQNNRREHAALLIAEAARRLGANAIVGGGVEPAKSVYEAFVALQPLTLPTTNKTPSVQSVAFSPDGLHIATATPRQIAQLVDVPQAATVTAMPIGYGAAAFSPDSRYVAAGGRDATTIIWTTTDHKRIWQSKQTNPDVAWVTAVTFAQSNLTGNLLAVGTEQGDIYIYKEDASKWYEESPLHEKSAVRALAFSPGSSALVVAGANGDVHVVPYEQLRPQGGGYAPDRRWSLKGEIRALVFAPGTPERFATASAEGTAVWPLDDSKAPPIRIAAESLVSALAFSPDGQSLAIAELKAIRFASAKTGQRTASIDAPGPRSLAFTADGALLVAGCSDRTVRAWDTKTRGEVWRITLPYDVDKTAVTASGKQIAITSPAGVYVAFLTPSTRNVTFPAGEVQASACSQTRETSLSAEDWKRYFGSEPLQFTCQPATPSQH